MEFFTLVLALYFKALPKYPFYMDTQGDRGGPIFIHTYTTLPFLSMRYVTNKW